MIEYLLLTDGAGSDEQHDEQHDKSAADGADGIAHLLRSMPGGEHVLHVTVK